MRRLTRTAIGTALAMGLVAATTTQGVAAAYPGPRSEQWWFTVWAVQNKVWPIAQGKGVTVALLDTGVQADLPEFHGAILPGTNANDESGDGRIDEDTSPVPGHGTGMATLIAAQGRGTGAVGVAPAAKILPVVVHSGESMVTGIRYAVDHGAKVINISQGAAESCPSPIQDAVAYAIQHDVVIVASSGDSGNTSNASEAPGNCTGVLTVGAVDPRLHPWTGTQRQPYVSVAAPGVGVGGVLKDGQWHSSPGGTSGATALTSAAVALVRSKYPNLSAREVVQRIIASTRDAGPKGRDDMTGYGAVRPYQALTMSVPKNAPNPVFAAYDKWAAANGKATQDPEAAAQHKKVEESSNDMGFFLMLLGLVVVIALVVVGLAMFMRSRNRRPAPMGPPGYPGQGPPQQWGPPQGPPTGFGAPPPGQPQPPPQQGVPPQQGRRPDFRPPQGPPRGAGHEQAGRQQPGSKVWPPPSSGGPRE